jgi:hypothetical protein
MFNAIANLKLDINEADLITSDIGANLIFSPTEQMNLVKERMKKSALEDKTERIVADQDTREKNNKTV